MWAGEELSGSGAARATHRPSIVLTLHMFGQGGTDRVAIHLANGFAAAGFDTHLLIFCRGGKAEPLLCQMICERVRIHYLGPRCGARAADLMLHLPEYARFLRRARPDWVLSTGNNMNWVTAVGLRLSGLTKTRLVMKTTNPIVRPRDKLLARTIRRAGYRRAFRAADAVLTLSDAETRQLQAMFPREASRFRTVINPYVTPDMLRERPFERSETERLVLAVGRLQPQKRMGLLIHAFAHVTTPGSRLVILGEGAERPRLEALVRDLGLSGRVELPGFDPDVGTWFARADLFVLPSVYEGLPAVVLEAMAANCPLVSTDCFPAARELVAGAEGCALLERPEPVLLARLIDERFAEPRPTSLRALAETYSIENAQRSHVEAVASLIARHAA